MSGGEHARTVFVISDLHIGGELGDAQYPRGFRMCTHSDALCDFIEKLSSMATQNTRVELIINGDFVDFLAEEDDGLFSPFLSEPERAKDVLLQIVAREKKLFETLKKHLQDGHRLTILLGNHDVELAHPLVMEALIGILGGASERLVVSLDGKPYRIGDALIEHGNLYDGFNAITAEEIAVLRSTPQEFQPPPGSRLVAQIMNPIKRDFPFVDLLKPEQEAAIPILLVLAPERRGIIADVVKLQREAKRREEILRARYREAVPVSAHDDEEDERELSREEALREVLQETLGDETQEFLDLLEEPEEPERQTESVAARTLGEYAALASLLLAPRRQKALWKALQVVKRDFSFITSK